jgi:1-deoxy-D-xylulose-5-phosphate reductoisomerase
MKNIVILGSTGSIGRSTLDVIRLHKKKFHVFALTANSQASLLITQIREFNPNFAVLNDVNAANNLKIQVNNEGLNTVILSDPSSLNEIVSHSEVDMVMAAIVGAAGLKPCLAAVRAGKKLLLANKETLVLGGQFFMNAVRENNAILIPIDSEHSAIFQSLPENPMHWKQRIHKIILTASGGPFRTRDAHTFPLITPNEACAHPNWIMGKKISVDSATMMNKALEIIEARFLFDVPAEKIEVLIHPQSIVHSMVRYHDASVVAQLGSADMRVPIAYGLSYPERINSGVPDLDFTSLRSLSFEKPDFQKFPGLQLAWDTLNSDTGATGVLNAANEIAVDAFLNKKIRFDQIHHVNFEVLDKFKIESIKSVDDLINMDKEARCAASALVEKLM